MSQKDHDPMETTPSPDSPCEWSDMAWSHVLSCNAGDRESLFRDHLLSGCGVCGLAVAQARAIVADIDLGLALETLRGGQSARPNPALKQRLLAQVKGRTLFARVIDDLAQTHAPTSFEGVSLRAAREDGWQRTTAEGVLFQVLSSDEKERRATALVRMAPGTSYPSHRHAEREECYVLTGDLSFGDCHMKAGDYQVAERGSVHPVQSTENGCTLLIISSLDDEPLEA